MKAKQTHIGNGLLIRGSGFHVSPPDAGDAVSSVSLALWQGVPAKYDERLFGQRAPIECLLSPYRGVQQLLFVRGRDEDYIFIW